MHTANSESTTPDLGHEDYDSPDAGDVGQTIGEDLVGESAGEPPVEGSADEAYARLESEHAELKDKYLRLMAEFDNFRKRTAKQRNEERATAAMGTMTSLLPVLDDFERAEANAEQNGAAELFEQGVGLVHQKLKRVLKGLGLERLESTGEAFDPEVHEAFTEIPAPSPDLRGKVVDTIEAGYALNDKLIRHAKVVVGK